MKKTLLALLLPLSISLFFTACKGDPCEGISCQNGGTCLNGLCSCATGYEGPACEKEKTPKAITITSIKLISFPATKPNGAGWDVLPSSGPDLYFKLINLTSGGILVKENSTTYVPDVTLNSVPFEFTFVPFKITDVTSRFEIDLFDWDTIKPDEIVNGLSFNLYEKGNKFPTKLRICEKCSFDVELTLSYEF